MINLYIDKLNVPVHDRYIFSDLDLSVDHSVQPDVINVKISLRGDNGKTNKKTVLFPWYYRYVILRVKNIIIAVVKMAVFVCREAYFVCITRTVTFVVKE